MGKIPIPYIVPFSLACKSIFDANKTGIVAFRAALADPFEPTTWVGQITATNGIINPKTITGQSKTNTKNMRKFMKNESPLLKNLLYYINLGIADNTITDSLDSFRLVAFNQSINDHDIEVFHNCYITTIAKVNSNQTALTTLGWLVADTLTITSAHNSAWALKGTNITLVTSRKNLSSGNLTIIDTLITTDKMVLETIRAYARRTNNTTLLDMSSEAAVLRSVRPTPIPKMRNSHIPKTTSRIHKTNPVARDTYKFKNKGKVSVFIVRSNSKVGPYSGGLEIKPGVEIDLKAKDIPGTGKYIIIYNPDTNTNAVLGCLTIKGSA